jgi:hypothetical protein|nr:MAG TPA: hypothetical protein [Caudoviricetes sp.]
MGWAGIALLVAFSVALAHHLGLVEKVAETVREIAGCARCSVFWVVFCVLLLEGVHAVVAFGAAIVLAYLTDWLGLLFFKAAKLYDKLWQRINNRQNGLMN